MKQYLTYERWKVHCTQIQFLQFMLRLYMLMLPECAITSVDNSIKCDIWKINRMKDQTPHEFYSISHLAKPADILIKGVPLYQFNIRDRSNNATYGNDITASRKRYDVVFDVVMVLSLRFVPTEHSCLPIAPYLQYIPRNMHTVLLCFALLWLCNRS